MKLSQNLNVGFTGTRHCLTERQEVSLGHLLRKLRMKSFHHGDCIGADYQAAMLIHEMYPDLPLVSHPPMTTALRAWAPYSLMQEPKPYLVRNREIVEGVDLLIACPKEPVEVLRSGTWATVRIARRLGVPVVLIWP